MMKNMRFGVFLAGAAAAVTVAVILGGVLTGVTGGMSPMRASALVSALTGVAWIQSSIVGAASQFQRGPGVRAAIATLPFAAAMVCAGELLFRGLALRYLQQVCGDRAAIALTAAAFGVYHLAGSGYWAIGAFFQFLMPCLGGVLFGWAAVRSRGLSLPIGLHLGGNWVQASVAGFRVAGSSGNGSDSIWRIPISTDDIHAIAAPDLAAKIPYLIALAIAALTTWAFVRVGAIPALTLWDRRQP